MKRDTFVTADNFTIILLPVLFFYLLAIMTQVASIRI